MKSGMLVGFAVAALCCGCGGRGEKTEAPAADAPPGVHTFTNTGETVSIEEVGETEAGKSVEADFDLDGLRDLAVVERDANGESRVGIYIRRRGSDAQLYYRGGWIRPAVPGDIIGVMSSRRDGFADLVLLMAQTNAPNTMLHFQGDGRGFTMVRNSP